MCMKDKLHNKYYYKYIVIAFSSLNVFYSNSNKEKQEISNKNNRTTYKVITPDKVMLLIKF